MNNKNTLLLRNVRPLGNVPTDLLVLDGRFADPASSPVPEHCPDIDGQGQLLLPGLVDAHTHIDKTFWGQPWQRHEAGPRIIDKIENERRVRRRLNLSPAPSPPTRCVRRSAGAPPISVPMSISTPISAWPIWKGFSLPVTSSATA
ncbi:hypothetical protein [Marinobacterium aestuariivivens]|uniref:Amidohydrolase-related domain-containing protein n=1 Tax=Marinobacterium aestuariivivens TaxID=1698799 RepID=A0ABW2A8I9_9GAMM